MALHWDLGNIKNWKEVCQETTGEVDGNGDPIYRINPITESLIYLTMAIGIVTITEKNWKEFAYRVRCWEKALGQYMYECIESADGKIKRNYFYINAEIVHQHIGLSTNASTKTLPQFKKDLWYLLRQDSTRAVDSEIAKMQKEAK